MPATLLDRITIDSAVMTGKPVIHGHASGELIVRMVAQGITLPDILADYPRLMPEDIQVALWYAAATVANKEIYPLTLAMA